MKSTWVILYGLAALLTLGPSSTAAVNNKACTNQTPGGIKVILTTTSNTVCYASDGISSDMAVYPLKDLEGKKVRVKLFDLERETETIIGPCESPKELSLQFPEKMKTTCNIIIEKVNPETGKWVKDCQFAISHGASKMDKPDSR